MPDSDEPINKHIDTLGILIGIAVGSLVTYILLRKGQTTALSTQTIPVQNHLDTDINQQIYNQQNELFDQIKLLNELLNRRDESLQQYHQTMLQQYQNIPSTMTNTINPELQQIASYLQNMNSQLEYTSFQLQEILKKQYQQTTIQQPSKTIQSHKQDNLLGYMRQQLQEDNPQQQLRSRKQTQQSKDDIYEQTKHIQPQQIQQENLQTYDTLHKDSDIRYKNKEQWAIKRGSDGRIRSLEIIRNAMTKKQ